MSSLLLASTEKGTHISFQRGSPLLGGAGGESLDSGVVHRLPFSLLFLLQVTRRHIQEGLCFI